MAVTSSSALIAAAADNDLIRRFVALGATLGMTRSDVEMARERLAAAPVDDQGNTVASVHEYASAVYNDAVEALPPRPGVNPASVTDAHMIHALKSIKDQTS